MSAVEALEEGVRQTHFVHNEQATHQATAVVAQVNDYILPRLADLDAPLLAVVGGSTGSGKSTLVNSLLQEQLSLSGVIRPTTRQPVLITHPADQSFFESTRVLPGLARHRGAPQAEATSLRLVSSQALHPGLAIIDAPDFDSIDDTNRALASQLLAAADLWIFVTTPARYADKLVWTFLQDAASRNIEVIVVLNRVDEDAMATVPEDLQRMMDAAGLGDSRLFVVPHVGQLDGLLDSAYTKDLLTVLQDLGADIQARRAVAAKTVDGALRKLTATTLDLAKVRAHQEELGYGLVDALDEIWQRGVDQVIDATSDGQLLRSEVMQRWQDVVGTSDAFRGVEKLYASARDKLTAWFTGKPAPLREVETEIETGLHAVILDAAMTAAQRSWTHIGASVPQLRAELDGGLATTNPLFKEQASALVRDWQAALVDQIQDTAGDKRMKARILSLGLNAVTVSLMIVVFASTAGLTGGELAIAGGSAVIGQKLLETVFGEDAVRRMAKQARDDLDRRISALFAAERARYNDVSNQFLAGTTAAELEQLATQATNAFNNLEGEN